MDERAQAELSQGQSSANQIEGNNQIIKQHNETVRQHYQNMNTTLQKQAGTNRHEDEGLDVVQTVSDVNDIANFGQARKLARGQLAIDDAHRAMALGRGATEDASSLYRGGRALAEATGLRTGAEIVRQTPGALGSAVGRGGQRLRQAFTKGATGGEDAEMGVGAVGQKVAGFLGADASRAGAIGDVVGHGIGGVLAGYNTINDITMSHEDWLKMDPEQRDGNILGIAGGIADVLTGAIPILAPIALGLNVASAVEGWMGDKDAQSYTENRTDLDKEGNPMGLKGQETAGLQKTGGTMSATASGLVPQGATTQLKVQGGSGAF